MLHEPALPRTLGAAWREILRRDSLDAFSTAFTEQATLDASVLTSTIEGAAGIRDFFEATKTMYDNIAFVAESETNERTVLEWEGRFHGTFVAGITTLFYAPDRRIQAIRVYHRPLLQVQAFASELVKRLHRTST